MDNIVQDWNVLLPPLASFYEGRRYPLAYSNSYQLLVLLVVSAQEPPKVINDLAPNLFREIPDLRSLETSTEEQLYRLLRTTRNFENKVTWLKKLAKLVTNEADLPRNLSGLTKLPGISRKAAHILLRELGQPAEGVFVDASALRVARRLGMNVDENQQKAERQMMEFLDRASWTSVGFALSFHGNDICREKAPICSRCPMTRNCAYFQSQSASKV